MSNIAKALNIFPADRHTSGLLENNAVKFQYAANKNPNTMDTTHYLQMRAGVQLIVSDQVVQWARQTPSIKADLAKELIEVVYGEFRKPMLMLYEDLCSQDFDKARRSFNALYDQMFRL